ncbi:hypothetical protein EVJ58_g1687 [Rhodofomes roseus]|uniref:Uncharacterized protein n=1 Tax=Rhodofomes roseus TaxID=34475 RepID=A0A4Y9Z0G8_9APHY|nr:hypothetical protein EVJ58_g1687 [Rhodofomes roseus]
MKPTAAILSALISEAEQEKTTEEAEDKECKPVDVFVKTVACHFQELKLTDKRKQRASRDVNMDVSVDEENKEDVEYAGDNEKVDSDGELERNVLIPLLVDPYRHGSGGLKLYYSSDTLTTSPAHRSVATAPILHRPEPHYHHH